MIEHCLFLCDNQLAKQYIVTHVQEGSRFHVLLISGILPKWIQCFLL